MKHFTLVLLSFLTVLGATAQTNIEMTSINSPASNGVYTIGESVPFSFTFSNLGPDTLGVGDTLFANFFFNQSQPIQQINYVFDTTMAVNASLTLVANGNLTLQSTPGQQEICMFVNTFNNIDTDSTNNLLCQNYDLIDPVSVGEEVAAFASAYYNSGDLFVTLVNGNTAELEVIDITGRLVKQQTLLNTNEVVSMSTLPQGIYIAKMTNSAGETTSTKFMVN